MSPWKQIKIYPVQWLPTNMIKIKMFNQLKYSNSLYWSLHTIHLHQILIIPVLWVQFLFQSKNKVLHVENIYIKKCMLSLLFVTYERLINNILVSISLVLQKKICLQILKQNYTKQLIHFSFFPSLLHTHTVATHNYTLHLMIQWMFSPNINTQ